ncbi:hypothetical protein C8T65DRAFT_738606 [Cerioporus squamosus]|nr:hypothetical protein C8T65DRAFT_738606 [Cerioporus squamosus]
MDREEWESWVNDVLWVLSQLVHLVKTHGSSVFDTPFRAVTSTPSLHRSFLHPSQELEVNQTIPPQTMRAARHTLPGTDANKSTDNITRKRPSPEEADQSDNKRTRTTNIQPYRYGGVYEEPGKSPMRNQGYTGFNRTSVQYGAEDVDADEDEESERENGEGEESERENGEGEESERENGEDEDEESEKENGEKQEGDTDQEH